MDLTVIAGAVSTILFASANLPMVVKAIRSRDLTSYSESSLVLGNLGNAVYTLYVVSLPFGPVWILHGFYLLTMAAMLVMSRRFRETKPRASGSLQFARGPWPRANHTRASEDD